MLDMEFVLKSENLSYHQVSASIAHKKRMTGLWYGIFAGGVFALTGWGWDAYVLSQFHGYLPWFSLTFALLFCAAVGALAGWLTMRFEKAAFGFFFWLLAALAFTWLTSALNSLIKPALILRLNPALSGLLDAPSSADTLEQFWVIALFLVPLTAISGALQIQFVESSVFSPSRFGKFTPFFISLIIMTLNGLTADTFSNKTFRGGVAAVDTTVQFVVENKNNANVDKDEIRRMRARVFTDVQESVSAQRSLLVASSNKVFEEVYVLIHFEKAWVNCLTVSEQLVMCKNIDLSP